MRVLHVNTSVALGQYGVLFGHALSSVKGVEVLSVFNERLLENDTFKMLLTDIAYRKLLVKTPADVVYSMASLRRLVRRWKPDIIHDSVGPMSRSPFLWLALRHKAPLVMTIHDPLPHSGMGYSIRSRIARKLAHKLGSHFFVHGPIGKMQLVDQGVDPNTISIIRHGPLTTLFEQDNAKSIMREARTVLFFGGMRPNKGMELLLPIADEIHSKFQDVKFIVAGSPKVSRELQKTGWPNKLSSILNEMKKRSYFEVHAGFVPNSEVGTLFHRASITLLPYLDASQSGVAMIAMPLGSVVLATKVGDLPYTIKDGLTGFLAEPDVDSIILMLAKLLGNPDQLEYVRNNARDWVYRECSWEKQVAYVLGVYKDLLEGGGNRR